MNAGYTLPTQAGPKSGGGGIYMLLWIVVTSFIASQVIAARFAFNPELGTAFVRVALLGRLYAPWSVWYWLWKFSGFSGRVYDAPVSLWTPWAHNAIAQGIVIGFVGGLFAMFVIAALFARMTPQQSVKNLADSSGEWATEADVERAGFFANAGIILGWFPAKHGPRVMRYRGDSGMNWTAPPGLGKTSGLVVPNLVSLLVDPDAHTWSPERQRADAFGREPSHFALDVRGYLSKATSGWRRLMGHYVYIIEPFSTKHGRSKINPLWTISYGYKFFDHCFQAATDGVGDTEGLVTSTGSGGGTYWDQACTGFFAAVIGTLALRALYENMPRLLSYPAAVDYIESFDSIEDLLINMEFTEHDPHGILRAAYPALFNADGKCIWITRCVQAMQAKEREERSGVYGTLAERLNFFHSPVVRQHIEESTFTAKGVVNGSRPACVYYSVPGMKLDVAKPLTRVLISHFLRETTEDGSENQQGREVRGNSSPLIMWLDEIAAAKNIPVLASSIGFLRGHGVYPMLFWQSAAQLFRFYSHDETLTEALAIHGFMAPNTHGAAKRWSEQIGEFSLSLAKTSTTTSAIGVPSINSSVEIHKRALLTAGEVLRLRRDQSIIMARGLKMRVQSAYYYLDKSRGGWESRTRFRPVVDCDVTTFRPSNHDELERELGASALQSLLQPIPPPPPYIEPPYVPTMLELHVQGL